MISDMTVLSVHQVEKMMTLVGVAVIKIVVDGVWTDLIVNKNPSQSQ